MNPFFEIRRNLLLTVLIEGAVMLAFTKSRQKLYHSVLVNMLTNPLLNLCLVLWSAFITLPAVPYYYIALAGLEVCAVLTEAVLYARMRDFGIKKALLASFGLHSGSVFAGFLLQ